MRVTQAARLATLEEDMQRANQEYAAAVARASASHIISPPPLPRKCFVLLIVMQCCPYRLPPTKSEALHAQISETLRAILSDDEFAAEAEAPG